MKALLLVILLLSNGGVDLSHVQYNSLEECKAHIDNAIGWANSQPNVKGAVALCTTKLQVVPQSI